MEDEYWLSDERESFPQFWYAPLLSPRFLHILSFFPLFPVCKGLAWSNVPRTRWGQTWCHGCFSFPANPSLSNRHGHHDAWPNVQGLGAVHRRCAGGLSVPLAVWLLGRRVLVGSMWEVARFMLLTEYAV